MEPEETSIPADLEKTSTIMKMPSPKNVKQFSLTNKHILGTSSSFRTSLSNLTNKVYWPQANPVEKKNRDLKPKLAILVGGNHATRPIKLFAIRFALNAVKWDTTGQIAAFLQFGRTEKRQVAKFATRRDGSFIMVTQRWPISYQAANPTTSDMPVVNYHASTLRPYLNTSQTEQQPIQPLRKLASS
ncbi:reverse transcriptase [Caerostris darwini]|uniref:Reverse transcriptase n=1 Tax=Caerostris darwini TaxID=1538125 RepID=A0AAV4W7X6_9ARAC|nr:reverse transcriptase [Caerostris darwini]